MPLRQGEAGVTSVTVEYGDKWNIRKFHLGLWLEVFVPSYSPTVTRSSNLESLLKEKQITLLEDELVVKTRGALVQSLARMGALFRAHCDEVMHGNLELVAKAYARPPLLAKEVAVDWARKEAERAWQAKEWHEVIRLYHWMGELTTDDEKGRLAAARQLLKDQG